MEFLDIHGIACKWLTSDLGNRKQFMSIDTCKSDVPNVLCGMPQCSIFGPKLFIMYASDMCNISKLVKYIVFADDTKLECVCSVQMLLDTYGMLTLKE